MTDSTTTVEPTPRVIPGDYVLVPGDYVALDFVRRRPPADEPTESAVGRRNWKSGLCHGVLALCTGGLGTLLLINSHRLPGLSRQIELCGIALVIAGSIRFSVAARDFTG